MQIHDCLFCKIVRREIPASITHEDEQFIAFDDINPQAPIHKLIIPKRHITTVNDIEMGDSKLIGELIYTAKNLANALKISEPGYRLVLNCNADGGQAVYHIHVHLLGGRQMSWPPG